MQDIPWNSQSTSARLILWPVIVQIRQAQKRRAGLKQLVWPGGPTSEAALCRHSDTNSKWCLRHTFRRYAHCIMGFHYYRQISEIISLLIFLSEVTKALLKLLVNSAAPFRNSSFHKRWWWLNCIWRQSSNLTTTHIFFIVSIKFLLNFVDKGEV